MNTIATLFNKYKGKKALVLGNGLSVKTFRNLKDTIVIGVNDINKLIDVDFHLLVDTYSRFNSQRIEEIKKSKATFFITQENRGWTFAEQKQYFFVLGSYGSFTNLVPNDKLDYGLDSPYMGILLAYKLGIKKIGILGVDYTPGHFYNETDGDHQLIKLNRLNEVIRLYSFLDVEMKKNNIEIYNLNKFSKINVIPYLSIDDFEKLNP